MNVSNINLGSTFASYLKLNNKLTNILLIGASDYGIEVTDLIDDINTTYPNSYKIIGFIDDNKRNVSEFYSFKILGNTDWLIEHYSDLNTELICCIGNPIAKFNITTRLKKLNPVFSILVHPTAIVSKKATIDPGSIIMAGNIISTSAQVKNHVIINLACTIGHNTIICDYCTVNPGSNISGNVLLNEQVYVGTNATILQNLQIGKSVTIGAGAIIVNNIDEGFTVVAMPSRPVAKKA